MSENAKSEPKLTPAELAERTGRTIGTLANWRSIGIGPKFMKPNNLRSTPVHYLLSHVIEWETASIFQSTHEAEQTRRERFKREIVEV